MMRNIPFPLYDRLKQRYLTERHQSYDLIMESAKINTLTRQEGPEIEQVKEYIYALIFHHAIIEGIIIPPADGSPCPIPYRGEMVQKLIGVSFNMRYLPPVLLQIIIRFVNEIMSSGIKD